MQMYEAYFSSAQYLEPKCPGCGVVLDYGSNTRYDELQKAHVCLKCSTVLK